MKCLRCGRCCIAYEVIIVDDPELGIAEDNLIAKHTGDKCPHLENDGPGEYSCNVHDCEWYKQTPCFSHTQIEQAITDSCRTGEYLLNNPHLAKIYLNIKEKPMSRSEKDLSRFTETILSDSVKGSLKKLSV